MPAAVGGGGGGARGGGLLSKREGFEHSVRRYRVEFCHQLVTSYNLN